MINTLRALSYSTAGQLSRRRIYSYSPPSNLPSSRQRTYRPRYSTFSPVTTTKTSSSASSSFSYQASRSASSTSSPTPQSQSHPDLTSTERQISAKLHAHFAPTKLSVQDTSGGCGSMFAIEIESARFAGLSMIRQHRLVNEVLKEEIGGWHGVRLRTAVA